MVTKLTSMRLTEADLALIDAIQQHLGTSNRSEALRVALNAYARSEGILEQAGRVVGPRKPKALPAKSAKKGGRS